MIIKDVLDVLLVVPGKISFYGRSLDKIKEFSYEVGRCGSEFRITVEIFIEGDVVNIDFYPKKGVLDNLVLDLNKLMKDFITEKIAIEEIN